jgi:hypothetical protein
MFTLPTEEYRMMHLRNFIMVEMSTKSREERLAFKKEFKTYNANLEDVVTGLSVEDLEQAVLWIHYKYKATELEKEIQNIKQELGL